jgi:hypothetical protein
MRQPRKQSIPMESRNTCHDPRSCIELSSSHGSSALRAWNLENDAQLNKIKLMRKYILIESEGLLYRGPNPNCPIDIWRYPTREWVHFKDGGPKQPGWGEKITVERAERLKTNNPAAEHFMYYDTPPWSQPLGPGYDDGALPRHLKGRLCRVRPRRGEA